MRPPDAIDGDVRHVLDHGYVRLIWTAGAGDLEVVNDARASFAKEHAALDGSDYRLIRFLVGRRETSPMRGSVVKFEVAAPLMVARQWWKYHVASQHVEDQDGWNEASRRYITRDPVFYVPDQWRSAPENAKQGSGEPILNGEVWTSAMNQHVGRSLELYEQALKAGVAPEQALIGNGYDRPHQVQAEKIRKRSQTYWRLYQHRDSEYELARNQYDAWHEAEARKWLFPTEQEAWQGIVNLERWRANLHARDLRDARQKLMLAKAELGQDWDHEQEEWVRDYERLSGKPWPLTEQQQEQRALFLELLGLKGSA